MLNKKFLIRFISFSIFACVIPFSFVAWKYKLFEKDKLSITGWGMIAILILSFFAIYLLNAIKKGMPYSMFTQVVNGIMKVEIPLIMLYMLVISLQNTFELFLQCLTCIIVCEGIAIPLNPLPGWIGSKRKRGK